MVKPIPRNTKVWKAVGRVTKEKWQKIYSGDMKGRWSYCISVTDIDHQFVCCGICKLRSGPVDWMTQHCAFIVPCPPNSTRSSAIDILTGGIKGWCVQYFHCLWMVIPMNYLTYLKTLFSILNY